MYDDRDYYEEEKRKEKAIIRRVVIIASLLAVVVIFAAISKIVSLTRTPVPSDVTNTIESSIDDYAVNPKRRLTAFGYNATSLEDLASYIESNKADVIAQAKYKPNITIGERKTFVDFEEIGGILNSQKTAEMAYATGEEKLVFDLSQVKRGEFLIKIENQINDENKASLEYSESSNSFKVSGDVVTKELDMPKMHEEIDRALKAGGANKYTIEIYTVNSDEKPSLSVREIFRTYLNLPNETVAPRKSYEQLAKRLSGVIIEPDSFLDMKELLGASYSNYKSEDVFYGTGRAVYDLTSLFFEAAFSAGLDIQEHHNLPYLLGNEYLKRDAFVGTDSNLVMENNSNYDYGFLVDVREKQVSVRVMVVSSNRSAYDFNEKTLLTEVLSQVYVEEEPMQIVVNEVLDSEKILVKQESPEMKVELAYRSKSERQGSHVIKEINYKNHPEVIIVNELIDLSTDGELVPIETAEGYEQFGIEEIDEEDSLLFPQETTSGSGFFFP